MTRNCGGYTAMADVYCTCECGHSFRMSEFAIGSTQRCQACGKTFKATEDSCTPVEDAPGAPPDTGPASRSAEDSRTLQGRRQCARCGREFRGEWDRYTTDAGVMICHLCANLAGVYKPQVTPTVTLPEQAEPIGQDSLAEPFQRPSQPVPSTFSDRFAEFRETRAFRAGLYVAAFAVMGAGLYYALFPPEEVPTETARPAESEATADEEHAGRTGVGLLGPPEELTEGQHALIAYIVIGIAVLLKWVPCFAALLLIHVWGNDMPGSSWWAAAIHIGIVSVIMAALGHFFSFFMVGWILALAIAGWVYGLRFGEVIQLVALLIVLHLLMVPVGYLVHGGLGLLLV